MRLTWLASAFLALAFAAPALAGSDAVKIGVLTDMSGTYSDNLGPGAVLAAQMAVDEFGGRVNGKPIQLIVADHQNKPDVGVGIVRQWLDVDGVDTVTEIGNSAVALALHDILEQRKKVALVVGAGTTALTGKQCSRFLSQWNLDTYATANGVTRALVGAGKNSWFFITVDYTYGANVQDQATETIKSLGGSVVGSVRTPLGESEFSQYLLQAQSSGAKVVGFIIAGNDLSQALKQAHEFGLDKSGQQLVPFLLFPPHIAALGLDVTKGLVIADSFYADHNDQTRKFAADFTARFHGKVPTSNQVGEYIAIHNYLRAVQASGTDDGAVVADKLRSMDIDNFGEPVRIRADGRVMRDLYLLQVKSPAEARSPTDYFKYLNTIPAVTAYLPATQSECPLLK
jgi:branched-chain amino acid transport system substrate-binding protein